MALRRALLVEDDFVSRKLFAGMLRGRFVCDVAGDGLEALEAYNLSVKNGLPYDIIIMDIGMPRVSGSEALMLIREAEAREGIKSGQGVPVLIITAHKSAFGESFRAGCDAYLTKPVSAESLLAKTMEVILDREGTNEQKHPDS